MGTKYTLSGSSQYLNASAILDVEIGGDTAVVTVDSLSATAGSFLQGRKAQGGIRVYQNSGTFGTESWFYEKVSESSSSINTRRTDTKRSWKFNLIHSSAKATFKLNLYMLMYVSGNEYIGIENDEKRFIGNIDIPLPAKTSYAVTYNANGGTGSVASQTKWYDESLTISSNAFTRAGYSFYRWNTAADGSGTWYDGGATYTTNAAVTLYAIWSPTIAYNVNGGNGSFATQNKTFGVNITLNENAPTRANYVFWHWNTSIDNTGASYNPRATYSSNEAATLYAIWNPYIYFNGNGSGAGNIPTTQMKTFGVGFVLPNLVPTRPGYEFVRWTTAANGTGTAYNPGATYTGNATMTLYAQWRRTAYPPTISSMSVVRCNSSGVDDDLGTYFRCTVSWSVDTTADDVLNNQLTSLTGSYVPSTGGTAITWSAWSGTTTGTSGTASAIVGGGNVDTDTQYNVTVYATDEKPQTTARSDVLTRAFFIIDFNSNGDAVGIGSAAPSHGLEIGWDVQIDDDLSVLGDIEADNYKVTSKTQSSSGDVISAAGTWTIVSAQAIKCGHLCQVYISAKNSQAVSAGSSSQVGVLANGFVPRMLATFGCPYGGGYISGSSIYIMPHIAISANASINIGATFYVDA